MVINVSWVVEMVLMQKILIMKCDGHSNTLTLLLTAKNSSFFFVGFASIPWHSLDSHVNDLNAFEFGLTNKDGQWM